MIDATRSIRLGVGIIAGIVALMPFVTESTSAQGPPTVALNGNVVNGTDGAALPEGLEVFLLVIDEEEEAIVQRVSTIVDADGTFTVDAPELASGQFYRVVADDGVYTPYQDITDPNLQPPPTLTVFNRTTALDDIAIDSYGVVFPVIDSAESTIAVLAAISLNNDGDEVFVADLADPALTGVKLLRFNLPEGYAGLNVESDLPSGNVMEINTGFALSNPVPPGEWDLIVSYTAPYEQNTFNYPFRLPFGANQVSFLVPEGQGELAGLDLVRVDTVDLNDTTFVQYEGTRYERGAQLDVVITGLPNPGIDSQLLAFFRSTQFQVALAITVGLLLAGGLTAYMIVRRPIGREADPAIAPEPGNRDRASIVASIAELDRRHDAGEVEESFYLEQRRRLVESAIEADD